MNHTTTKSYLITSLILAAGLILGFVDDGFSAEPQQSGSMPANPPITIRSYVPQDSTKSYDIRDIKNYQTGFHKSYVDGYDLAKNGGSRDDLFNMKKATKLGIIIGMTDITNVGYDKGLSQEYNLGITIINIKKQQLTRISNINRSKPFNNNTAIQLLNDLF